MTEPSKPQVSWGPGARSPTHPGEPAAPGRWCCPVDEDPASPSAPYTTHVCERRGPPPRRAPWVPVFTQPGRGPQGVRPGSSCPPTLDTCFGLRPPRASSGLFTPVVPTRTPGPHCSLPLLFGSTWLSLVCSQTVECLSEPQPSFQRSALLEKRRYQWQSISLPAILGPVSPCVLD